jgi:hypothetical protein
MAEASIPQEIFGLLQTAVPVIDTFTERLQTKAAAERISVQFRNGCLNNFTNRQTANRAEPCILHDPQTFTLRAKSDSFFRSDPL